MLRLFNSLTRKIEDFQPIQPDKVGLYTCGPTVYNYAHIGNLRTMIMSDLVRRALEFSGYQVTAIMNITDVGHLTSDGDTGEDKMEKGLSTKEDVMAIAQKYTDSFLQNLKDLNILSPTKMPKASEHIADQIAMIERLIQNGFAYVSDQAVYFDISKTTHYTQLIGQSLEDMKLGARQEVVSDPAKKNPHDFVLWFKTTGRYANHILKWPSPWGDGFPGWHIECSAMSQKYLGTTFDIHTGGVDLKFPHHTNEIAQSFGANHAPLAKYWLHAEHLLVNEGKMAKSDGTFLVLQNVVDKKINPLAFRYLALTTHYRSKLNFSWESLQGAANALNNLYSEISSYETVGVLADQFDSAFAEAINDDLNTPKAIAVVWDLVNNDEVTSPDKLATLIKFDSILGLRIKETWELARKIPVAVKTLVEEREQARKAKDFAKSDDLRKQIEAAGFVLEDTVDGVRLMKKF